MEVRETKNQKITEFGCKKLMLKTHNANRSSIALLFALFSELSKQLNMQGVFLHVLSDAIGSVIVIVTALVCWLVPGHELLKLYLDPTLRFVLP